MNRIQDTFSRARQENRACFVSYVCAGDPDAETSLAICRELLAGGTDILELGVPFSDPLADGLTNQLAAERALNAGMTPTGVFELVKTLRQETEAPIVFYTYYNLVFANGVEAYVAAAKEAGVDALLTLDLPPEEAEELAAACEKHGVGMVFIIAPTTPAARMPIIAQAATSFIYYVSREGVTGVREGLADNLTGQVAEIRAHTDLPVAVGFGIGQPDQVAAVAKVADGVIVGSALVNQIATAESAEAAIAGVAAKVRELAPATRR